jgi:branched-chain amino acid transport system ATP-binding protein
VLEIRDLHAAYGQTRVLEGVDLSVGDGEFVIVIGPNGHGKTTLLRTISGLMQPTSGEIGFAGERIDGVRPETIATRGLVHIPQGDLPFGDMTVEENMLLGAFVPDAWGHRIESLERVYAIFPALAERRTQRARTLSGGERRMLALGRGLMRDAKMLMIDEPSLGLAPVMVKVIYQTIRRIRDLGMTILIAEQSAHVALKVANRALVLETGRVAFQGDADALALEAGIKEAYFGAAP